MVDDAKEDREDIKLISNRVDTGIRFDNIDIFNKTKWTFNFISYSSYTLPATEFTVINA